MILRTFGWSFAVTIAGLIAAFLYDSTEGLLLVLILAGIAASRMRRSVIPAKAEVTE